MLEHILAIIGAVVPLLSALSSMINHIVRSKQADGQAVSPALLGAGTVINVGAVNLDKALQLARLLRDSKQPENTETADKN